MSELNEAQTGPSQYEIVDLLKTAYQASDLIGQIMTADIPVRSPVYQGRYERTIENAGARYKESVDRMSLSAELQQLSEAIHGARCGCAAGSTEGCDWYATGGASSAKSTRILQAAELKLSNFTTGDILEYPEHFNKFIDYLEAPREERPRLQAELEQLFAETTAE